jgi:hypothetical protein
MSAMRHASATLLIPGLVGALAAGCTRTSGSDDSTRWLQVARDSNHKIAIDTTQIARPNHRQWYVVWYRTDHAQTSLHKGKTFNREIVKSLLRCDEMTFKIASVDMSLGANRPIARQRANPEEIAQQPWRNVERATIEEVAARATCDFARRRYVARAR